MRVRAMARAALDNTRDVARWDALAMHACEPNPFYESWYLLPSLSAFDPKGEVELLVFEAGEQLAGLMPVCRSAAYYHRSLPHLRNWLHPNIFLGAPLVATGLEREFWHHVLAWADDHCGVAAFLHIAPLPLDGPVATSLRAVLQAEGRPAALVGTQERAMLQSNLSPDAYLEESLSTKKRKELRRQHRRLEEEGTLEFNRQADAECITSWAEQFLSLEMRGWKGEAGSALACRPDTERLFRQCLQGAATRGKLERLDIRLDGKPIAMLANFISGPGAFSFKTAFDEDFSRFSPGVLLQRENLAVLDRQDIAWCDSCAGEDHPMIDHFWRERRTVGKLNIAIGGAVRRGLFQILARLETGQSAVYAK